MTADRLPKTLMLLSSDFVKARYQALRLRVPELEVVTELAEGSHPDIEALFAFKLPAGIAPRLPNLRLAASVGAGADGLLGASDLPRHVQVTRASEPGLGLSMAQFVALQVLSRFRSQAQLQRQQALATWQRVTVPDARQCTVGVMGLGQIGAVVAHTLATLGFKVIGWTRTGGKEQARTSPMTTDVATHVGAPGLDAFLAASNFLVCLLPFTAETANLLDRSKLALLPQGAYVVNVARGGIVNEADLLALVDAGHLAGAALDVFATEPLPADSPLWRHPQIVVTPHVAAQPSVEPVVDQFIDNLQRLVAGQPLLHTVDRALGY